MKHSIAVCYVNDNGTNLTCKRVLWDECAKLRSGRKAILVAVYWDPGNGVPNRNDVQSHSCYSIERIPGDSITVRQVDITTQDAVQDITFGDDGATGSVREWTTKLVPAAIQAVVQSTVSLPAYLTTDPGYDDLLADARALADATADPNDP